MMGVSEPISSRPSVKICVLIIIVLVLVYIPCWTTTLLANIDEEPEGPKWPKDKPTPPPEYTKNFKDLLQPMFMKGQLVCTKSDFVTPNWDPLPSTGCSRDYKKEGITLLCRDPVEVTCGSSLAHTRDQFYKSMYRVTAHCDEVIGLGNLVTGGKWDVCFSGPFYPLRDSCLVYSFGIGNEWSFDDAISQRYGCEVHSFDPTMGSHDHNRSRRITFHDLGLSGTGLRYKQFKLHGWKKKPLGEILKFLGHYNRTIDVLKVDVEYSEWDAFEQAINGNALKNVKQLVTELHVWADHIKVYVRFHRILVALEKAGFEKWLVNEKGIFFKAFSPEIGGLKKYNFQLDVGFINRRFLK